MRATTILSGPLSVLVLACAATEVARPAPPQQPAAHAQRVVVLSLDGFAAERHRENLAQHV